MLEKQVRSLLRLGVIVVITLVGCQKFGDRVTVSFG